MFILYDLHTLIYNIMIYKDNKIALNFAAGFLRKQNAIEGFYGKWN